MFDESLIKENVSRVFPEGFMEISRKLSRCLKKVLCCMTLIAASRAEGGLVLLKLFEAPNNQGANLFAKNVFELSICF